MMPIVTVEPSAGDEPRRGRPRRPGTGARVREAAIEELIDGGLDGFSITRVARRAGVAKGTVTLRWPDPLELVLDALSSRLSWEPVPETGQLRQELLILADRLNPSNSAPLFGLIHSALGAVAARPEMWKRWNEVIVGAGLELARTVFDRAVARGDVPASVDVATLVMIFVGGLGIATQAKPRLRPPDKRDKVAIVDAVLRACQ